MDKTILTVADAWAYVSVNHLDKPIDFTKCHFCEEVVVKNIGTPLETYTEEVGEFWSNSMQQSVLAHPDCLPNGIDAVFEGTDKEWSMA